MTLDELRRAVAAQEIDTVLLALTDMQGRLQGKRFTARPLPGHGPAPRRRGLQLPARRRRRDEHRRRLRDELVGARLRRLRDGARPRDAAPHALAAGHRAAARRRAVARPHAGRRLAAPDPARARSQRLAERGWTALAATELELLLFRDLLPRRAAQRLPRPRPGQPLQRRLLDPRHLARRAAILRRIRNEMSAAGPASSRTPRASATSASTRSTSPTTRRCATADKHAIYKNGAKEIADQEGMSISFMAKFDEREGNSCHVHLSLRDARRQRRSSPTSPRSTTRSSPASSRRSRELTLLHAPNVNSYKRFVAGLVRADDDRLGHRQPHVRVPRRSATAPRKRIECRAAGRRREPLPRARGADRRRAARRRAGLELEPELAGQRLRVRPSARAVDAARRARPVRRQRRRARGVRPGDRRPLPQQRRVELDAFDAAVTDWERERGFERL